MHTDRDNRIKVQFHWQRGANSHRLNHPAGNGSQDNAPGDDSIGTWVRVSQAWAGANWGGHHTRQYHETGKITPTELRAD